MKIPTLVISDPPHGEVNLDAVAGLLGLDVFTTRVKVSFAAPEVMWASGPEKTADFAAELRGAGFSVAIIGATELTSLPWPDPVTFLAFDELCLRATVRNEGIEIASDAEVVGVYCRPPADSSTKPTVALARAIASGHGPTIAESIQWMSNLDLYFRNEGSLRRISIVPDLFDSDGDEVVKELGRRFNNFRLDDRLAGVRPRARFTTGDGDEVRLDLSQRKGFSFGTPLLRHLLESTCPELRDVPQYELGSRMAYALGPLGGPADPI